MRNLNIEQTANAWSVLAGSVSVPRKAEEYDKLVLLLDGLIDEVGGDESHPLASLMEVIGVLIEKYEDEHVPELTVDYKAMGSVRSRSAMKRTRNTPRTPFSLGVRRATANPIKRS
jgi:HTH-type transcriptional regulator/antitoxin HigA